jgi:large subunit ribosomal protein L33
MAYICGQKNRYDPTIHDIFRWAETKEVYYMRVKVTLACTECKQRNYNTTKNKKNNPDRLEISKYCKFCKKHTNHKETK